MSIIQAPKGEWKHVELPGDVVANDDAFQFLASFEEIVDYEVIGNERSSPATHKNPNKTAGNGKKRKKNEKNGLIATEEETPGTKKKKRKRKETQADSGIKSPKSAAKYLKTKSDTIEKLLQDLDDEDPLEFEDETEEGHPEQLSNGQNQCQPPLSVAKVTAENSTIAEEETSKLRKRKKKRKSASETSLKNDKLSTGKTKTGVVEAENYNIEDAFSLEQSSTAKKNENQAKAVEDSEPYKISNNIKGMENWSGFYVPDKILSNLKALGFDAPTEIQKMALPHAIRDKLDILGAAETGSGKTLAFGIPVVAGILQSTSNDGLISLILTPTRELAVQIKQHLLAITKNTDVRITTVIGGLSIQKQERLLKRKPQIVVATPGRLWAFMQSSSTSSSYLKDLSHLRYLVIDETDRMIEKGHFEELTEILEYANKNSHQKRQTFVFSATLTYVHPPPRRFDGKKEQVQLTTQQKTDEIISLTGLRKERKVIDITKSYGTAESLTEARINCEGLLDKDTALYYFLLRYPGRTLVFSNSIDSSRRLHGLLTKLQLSPLLLHARMMQKQRLKNLERFTGNDKTILLATDVAARGLDIQQIQHVVHYHVPRTAETYVHRSGRTARGASTAGLSVMLIDPNDAQYYRRICRNLNREKDLPIFPVDDVSLDAARDRMRIATEIESSEYRIRKAQKKESWFEKQAKEADLIIDEDTLANTVVTTEEERSQMRVKAKSMTAKLLNQLREPLPTSKNASLTRYPTLASIKEHLNSVAIGERNAIQSVMDNVAASQGPKVKVGGRIKVKSLKDKLKKKGKRKRR